MYLNREVLSPFAQAHGEKKQERGQASALQKYSTLSTRHVPVAKLSWYLSLRSSSLIIIIFPCKAHFNVEVWGHSVNENEFPNYIKLFESLASESVCNSPKRTQIIGNITPSELTLSFLFLAEKLGDSSIWICYILTTAFWKQKKTGAIQSL